MQSPHIFVPVIILYQQYEERISFSAAAYTDSGCSRATVAGLHIRRRGSSHGPRAVERSLRSCARMLVDLEARADACGTLSIIAEETPSGYWWLLRDCQALVALLCAASAIRSRTKVCLAEKHRFADAAAAIAQEIVRSVRAEETESTTRAPSL